MNKNNGRLKDITSWYGCFEKMVSDVLDIMINDPTIVTGPMRSIAFHSIKMILDMFIKSQWCAI